MKEQQANSGLTAAGMLGLVRLVIRTWSYSIEVFLRSGFGSRYAMLESLLVIPLVLFYVMKWQEYDLRPMIMFIKAYLGVSFLNRLEALLRNNRWTSNFYTGWPRFARLMPRLSERTIKLYVEPLIGVWIALLIGDKSLPLCTYLCIASVCLMIESFTIERHVEQEAKEMYDRLQWQQHVGERFRDRYSGQF